MLCLCVFLLSFALAVWCSVTLCHVPATPQSALITGLPDNDRASPAARRACRPVGRIEVNKPKCMYMHHGRLLVEQRGSSGTHLLRFLVSLNSPVSMTLSVFSDHTHSFEEKGTCAHAYKWQMIVGSFSPFPQILTHNMKSSFCSAPSVFFYFKILLPCHRCILSISQALSDSSDSLPATVSASAVMTLTPDVTCHFRPFCVQVVNIYKWL